MLRLLTAGGHQASHMDLIWVWQTGSIGVPLPTRSRMVLAGYKSVCSVLPVWAGFSQNEYLWCFHISDQPLEFHNVVWIWMRLMAAAQCPTTKTNSCKSDPVHRGFKLNRCKGLNDPVVTARPACWWAPYGNMGWGPQLQVGDLKAMVGSSLNIEITPPLTSYSLVLIYVYILYTEERWDFSSEKLLVEARVLWWL